MNLQDILSRFGVTTSTQSKNVRKNWIGVDCPTCSPGWNKFKMGFEISSGRCNCWTCGRCDPIEALSKLCRISIKEALTFWGNLPRAVYSTPELAHTGRLSIPHGGPLLPAHRNYLQHRGFDPDQIQQVWGIQGIGPLGKHAWTLLIPIFDQFGRTVSWTTRTIGDVDKRYHSASPEEESVPHKSILYGAHLARYSIVICEGPIDAWAIGPGAVATCGVGFSQSQMAAMAQYPTRIVCFDAEDQAQRRAEELCKNLSSMPGVTENVILETGKDPADSSKEEISELREQYL